MLLQLPQYNYTRVRQSICVLDDHVNAWYLVSAMLRMSVRMFADLKIY